MIKGCAMELEEQRNELQTLLCVRIKVQFRMQKNISVEVPNTTPMLNIFF